MRDSMCGRLAVPVAAYVCDVTCMAERVQPTTECVKLDAAVRPTHAALHVYAHVLAVNPPAQWRTFTCVCINSVKGCTAAGYIAQMQLAEQVNDSAFCIAPCSHIYFLHLPRTCQLTPRNAVSPLTFSDGLVPLVVYYSACLSTGACQSVALCAAGSVRAWLVSQVLLLSTSQGGHALAAAPSTESQRISITA